MKSKCIVIICILYADMFRIYHFGVMLIMKHILILLSIFQVCVKEAPNLETDHPHHNLPLQK